MKYETSVGQSLYLVGDSEEFGNWKDFSKGKMKWTDGHIWILESKMIKAKQFLCYKYVLMKDDKSQIWEKGENRIADFKLLPD